MVPVLIEIVMVSGQLIRDMVLNKTQKEAEVELRIGLKLKG